MAQAGTVWVAVVPSLRGFVTKVNAEVKRIPDAKVKVVPVVDTAVWKTEVSKAAAAASPARIAVDLDTGAALSELAAFRVAAEAEIGQLPSHVDIDTNEAAAELVRWDAEAYALAGQIPSNVNVDTAEATGHLTEFREAAESEIGDLTANLNVDDGRAVERVDTFQAETKRKLEATTANITVDTGKATENVDAFEAETKRKLETITANVDADTGRATESVDTFEAETKRKLETTTANIDADTGRATEKVDAFEAESHRKLATLTANVDADTGRATEKIDEFVASSREKLNSLTANVDADTGDATEQVDEFDASSREKLKSLPANVDADTGKASADVDEFDGSTRGKLDHIPMNVDADTGTADAKVDSFRGNTREKIGRQTSNIDVDDSRANAKVDEFEANTRRKIGHQTSNVDVDTGEADAHLVVWKAGANRYVNNPITAFPRVNTSIADAELVAFKAEAQALVGTINSTLTLDVGGVLVGLAGVVSGLAAMYLGVISFANSWGIAEVAIAGVIALIGSLGPAVFALVGGVALIPALAAGAGFALGTLLLGSRGVFAALSAAFDPTQASQFQAALAKMSPQARDTMLAIQGLSGALNLNKLELDVQDALFFHLADVVKQLGAAYIPLARTGFLSMATSINDAVRAFSAFLLIPQVLDRMKVAEDNITHGFAILTGGLETWGEAFTTLTAIGSAQLPRIAAGIAEVGTEFNDFINEVAASGELDAFLTRTTDEWGVLFHLVGQLGSIIISIFEAAGTSGVDLIRILDDGATALATFLRTGEGMSRVTSLFEASYQAIRNITPLIYAIGAALTGPIMTSFITNVPKVAAYFGSLSAIVPYLAQGFVLLDNGVTSVLQAFGPLAIALTVNLAPVVAQLIPLIVDLTNLVSNLLTPALYALGGPLQLVAGFLAGIRGALGDLSGVGFGDGGIVGYATGGVVPGYQPGRDTVPVLLSRGEGVLVPEAVQGLGPEFVGWANQHYSAGRSSGGRGTGPGFADGGLLLKQAIPAGTDAAAAIAPSLGAMRRGGIGTTSPGESGPASRGGGVTQNNYFNQPLDEQAYAAATLRRLDFAQRVAG